MNSSRTALQLRRHLAYFVLPILISAIVLFLSSCVTPSPDEWKPFPTLTEAKAKESRGQRGHVFPNLAFTDHHGNPRTISDYRGKVVFLNFWASWCPPCMQEMPGKQRLYDALKSDDDFAFIILNIYEDFEIGAEWGKKQGYTIPLSKSANVGKVSRNEIIIADGRRYSVRDIPKTFILDRNGVVVAFFGESHSEFDLYIDHMLELAGKPRRKKSGKSVHSRDGVEIVVYEEPHDGGAQYVRLAVIPKAPFKLAAAPGVILTAGGTPNIDWLSRFPMKHQRVEGYFETPPEFHIGFSAKKGKPAPVTVEYAYCKTEDLCYLRMATINLAAD
jgi:thiol-disulfide isomerase/thioredoxin